MVSVHILWGVCVWGGGGGEMLCDKSSSLCPYVLMVVNWFTHFSSGRYYGPWKTAREAFVVFVASTYTLPLLQYHTDACSHGKSLRVRSNMY